MNDDDDLDEDVVTNKLLDELGLPPTEANIERSSARCLQDPDDRGQGCGGRCVGR
jgi:hypothetical protein